MKTQFRGLQMRFADDLQMHKIAYSNLHDIALQGRGGRAGGPEPRTGGPELRAGGPERGAGGPERRELKVAYWDYSEMIS